MYVAPPMFSVGTMDGTMDGTIDGTMGGTTTMGWY